MVIEYFQVYQDCESTYFRETLNVGLTFLLISTVLYPVLLALVPRPAGSAPAAVALSTDSRGRYTALDVIRGIAILAVIVLHVRFLTPASLYVDLDQDALNILNAALRFALPVFFIISGMMLAPPVLRTGPVLAFYARQFLRVGLPFILVSAFLLWTQGLLNPGVLIRSFFTGEAAVPFYFMAILFQLYLIYPFIHRWALQRRWVYLALGVSLSATLYMPAWSVTFTPNYHPINVYTFLPHLFFFMWGIYLRQRLLEGSMPRAYWPWLTLVALFAFGYWLLPNPYYNQQLFYGPAIFMILYLALSGRDLSGPLARGLATLGRHSLWLFLLHFPLQWVLLPHVFRWTESGWLAVLLASGISIAVSATVASVVVLIYSRTIEALLIRPLFPVRQQERPSA